MPAHHIHKICSMPNQQSIVLMMNWKWISLFFSTSLSFIHLVCSVVFCFVLFHTSHHITLHNRYFPCSFSVSQSFNLIQCQLSIDLDSINDNFEKPVNYPLSMNTFISNETKPNINWIKTIIKWLHHSYNG